MTNYRFDFNLADQTRDQMVTITNRMTSMLAELDTEVRKELQYWESAAKGAYEISKQKWDAAAAQMPLALQRAQVTLTEISGGYLRVENTGVEMWGGGSR